MVVVQKRKIQSGRDIKEWRTVNRYDQDMLAQELGVTRQTIGNWERKEADIPRHLEITLQAIEMYPNVFRRVSGLRDPDLPL